MLSRLFSLAVAAALALPAAQTGSDARLRVVIAGLVHGHVGGFLNLVKNRQDVEIVGVFEPDVQLQKQYGDRYGLSPALFFTNLDKMLDQTKPEAIATFTDTFDHVSVVKAGARRHITVMMEKPLAVSVEHARQIREAANRGGIQIIVNYETTWYRSHAEMWNLIKTQKEAGAIRKMVAMDGHQGPREIHVGPEFFGWLTDPVKNGAGALFDFGCYGANLMTWMMDNETPVAVTATTQTFKPQIYGRVDDEANVLVEYAKAVGIIEGSWNWPFARKDFEVYGEHGYAGAMGGDVLKTRMDDAKQDQSSTLAPLPPDEKDSLAYLKAVARGKFKPSGLSSLDNNMIVVQILDAARESARTGKVVRLH